MVKDSRTPARADQLRPLNLPRPVIVERHQGLPVAVMLNGARFGVDQVTDSWQVEDEWWRDEIARHYYQVLLSDGRMLVIYHDVVENSWFEQRYPHG